MSFARIGLCVDRFDVFADCRSTPTISLETTILMLGAKCSTIIV